MNIETRRLQRLLLACPELRELRLIHVDLPITRDPILSSEVAAKCPKLRALHFSTMYSSTSRRHLDRLMIAFPTLESWGTSVADMGERMYMYLRLHMTKTLTTLEIWNTTRSGQETRLARGLHEFLCAAPNLLHLRAGEVELYEEDLVPIEPSTDEEEPADDNDANNDHVRKIWACRQLQTLHVGIRTYSDPTMNLTLKSRKLFAFIANVCPKLSDLRITHRKLDLGIDGGLCLLSELRNLQKLWVESIQGYLLWDEDLDWLRSDSGRVPWSLLSGKQKLEWNVKMRELRNSKVVKQDEIRMEKVKSMFSERTRGTSEQGEDDELVYRIQKASSLGNVFDVLDSLRKKEGTC
ncbi:hypothetical protein EDD21DRAFT_222264 [Dissophora ornata]|nr:hypothetical protein EDD21DRAFT_222264 [Dissophora ornata]